MYCGNNSQHKDLLSGKSHLGNRYDCLRKGIGKGMNLPVDSNYLGPYSPIDKRKVYCGKDDNLPDDYDLMGTLPHCLQKGIGIGKLQKALREPVNIFHKYKIVIMVIAYLTLIIGIFLILYFLRPSWITRIDSKGIVHIDFNKFIPIYIIICLGILVSFIGIWYQSE
jgi:hypothetical protein